MIFVCLLQRTSGKTFVYPFYIIVTNKNNIENYIEKRKQKSIFSGPGRSQGLLYKQPHDSLIDSVCHPFPPTALRRRHAQTVRDNTSNYKIDYVIVIKKFLNPKAHQNPVSGSKVTAILLKVLIDPIGGASSGRVCACSRRSRLVFEFVVT